MSGIAIQAASGSFVAHDSPAASAVRTAGLRKLIDGRTVLDGVTLELAQGSFTALLGANGAGKTTLLRVLATLVPATAGRLELFGQPAARAGAQVRGKIGMVAHQTMLYHDLSALENLELFARLHALPSPRARAESVLELLGVAEHARRTVKSLSRGTAQRVAIARAIVHEPRLLLADELFSGLDEAAAERVQGVLENLRSRGTTIVLTGHDRQRAMTLADRVVVLRQGQVSLNAGSRGLEADAISAAQGGGA